MGYWCIGYDKEVLTIYHYMQITHVSTWSFFLIMCMCRLLKDAHTRHLKVDIPPK